MKLLLSIILLFISSGVFSQTYNDTLFYNSGWERPVTILSINKKKIFFACDGKKGQRQSNVSISTLKGYSTSNPKFQDNKLSEYDDGMISHIDDTLVYTIRPGLISISPLDFALWGIGIDYSYRFKNSRHAMHIPFRATTLFGNTGYLSIGLGYSYFVRKSYTGDVFITGVPTFFYNDGGGPSGSIIFGFGGVRYFNSKLALNGFFGAGPAFGPSLIRGILFDAHIGIAFRFGASKVSKYTKRTD